LKTKKATKKIPGKSKIKNLERKGGGGKHQILAGGAVGAGGKTWERVPAK